MDMKKENEKIKVLALSRDKSKTLKSILTIFIVLSFLVILIMCITKNKSSIYANSITIEENEYDEIVVPDKYSTGCSGSLERATGSESGGSYTVNGVTFKGMDTFRKLEFYYGPGITESATISDIDFSDVQLQYYHGDMAENKDMVITFENCKFKSIKIAGVKTIFENCTFESVLASDAEFYNCYIGGSLNDGIRAFNNVYFESCYVADISKKVETSGTPGAYHTDGVQLYGNQGPSGTKGKLSNNLHFENCRFEVPPLPFSSNQSSVNACIMIALEYSDGDDISFTNCTINGGGYSIYCKASKLAEKVTNAVLRNIRVGKHRNYGIFYSVLEPTTTIENVYETNSLYVGSVWKDKQGYIHVSVTNDTNEDKILEVYTENGKEEFTVKAYPKNTWVKDKTFFEDLPYDIDYKLNGKDYVVCFDNTFGDHEQIRFVNYTRNKVTIDLEDGDFVNDVVFSSKSNQLDLTLYRDGTLVIEGNGKSDNYHSQKLSPWLDYGDSIRKIVIEEGVTYIGSQFFPSMGMSELVFPDSLEELGDRNFHKASAISTVSFGKNFKKLCANTFNYSTIKNVYYAGSKSEWEALDGGKVAEYFSNAKITFGKTLDAPTFVEPDPEELKRIEEEKKKAEEEKKKAEEEAARLAEEKRLAEEERLKAEEEAKRLEEERLKAEEEAKRLEEERKKAEEEARQAEAERLKAEEEAKKAEAERLKAEEEAKKAEAERLRLEAEEKERQRLLEEQRQKELAEEQERQRILAEEQKKLEELQNKEAKVTKIYISKEPSKKEFYLGELIFEDDYKDITVKAVYDDEAKTEVVLDNKNIKVKLEDAVKKLGSNKVVVIYDDFETSYTIQVKERQIKNNTPYMNGYTDHTFKPQQNVTREEFAKIISSIDNEYDKTKTYVNNFNDASSIASWARNYVGYIKEKKLIQGTNNYFNPKGSISRAEVCTIITRMLYITPKNSTKFSDVKGKWYEKEVTALAEMGVISGYKDNTFKGDNFITRAELCKIINNAFFKNKTVSNQDKENVLNDFKDLKKDAWYVEEITKAIK